MKILFSPSEGKKEGGDGAPFNAKSFCCEELFGFRQQMASAYQQLIDANDDATLSKLFGLKSAAQCAPFKRNVFSEPTMKAVQRYNGVAFEYLNYAALDKPAKRYIDEHCIIFSNLFGPVRALDMLPLYKLKQGEKIGDLALEQFYKQHFSEALHALLDNECVLDLRAGFYTKFYKPKQRVVTMKFIKGGKVVSHWAKAYRGIVLQQLALHNIDDFEALKALNIDGLNLQSIEQKKNEQLFIYDITG